MADETTFALLAANGGRISATLSGLVFDALHDATDLRELMVFVPYDQIGSDENEYTIDAVPQPAQPATNETTGGGGNTPYTTGKFSLNPVRYKLAYQMTDLFGVTGGPIDASRVVSKLDGSVGITMTDLCCGLFPAVSASVGDTNEVLTVDTVYDGQFQLNLAPTSGRKAIVLHKVGLNQFQADLRNEVGAAQWRDATGDMLGSKSPGFVGMWNNFEFHQNDSVEKVNANVDYAHCMFQYGAFAYTLRSCRNLIGLHINPADVLVDADIALVERSRDADNGMTKAILNLYPAVKTKWSNAAVKLIGKA